MILRARAAERVARLSDRRARGRAGITLLEMLMVMAILAVVLGGGVGLFASLDLGRRQAAGLVKSVVRSAQNTAVARQMPARVRIDKKNHTIRAEALQVIGTWHFENRKLEGFGMEGSAPSQLFHEDGFIGDAISFGRAFEQRALIPVDLDPAFDFAEGFAVECAIRWEDTGGGKLLRIGREIKLDLGRTGALKGTFVAAVRTEGEKIKKGAQVVVESPSGTVSPNQWVRVRLQYDRRELVLLVDGVPVAVTEETAPVYEITDALELSDGTYPFPGSIDALIVSAVAADQEVELAGTATFGKDTPGWIQFAPGGGLDRRAHPEPQEIVLTYNDGTQERIAVGIYGTVE